MPTNNLIRQLPMAGRANFLPYQIGADGKPHWALPGVLAGAANAVTAPYRAMNPQDYPDFNPDEEAANFALNMLGGGGAVGSAPKNALGMNVWHGSPHKFEPTPLNDLGEFNAAKIGTGEGAQAYSHGHYTGEARKTGEEYQSSTSANMYQTSNGVIRSSDLVDEIFKQSGNVPKQLESAYKAKANEVVRDLIMGKPYQEIADDIASSKHGSDYSSIVDAVKRLSPKAAQGHLYKVHIPDEHIAQMLDWDKPLSQQPEAVRRMLEKVAPSVKTVDTMSREELINTLQYIDRNGSYTDEMMINEFGRPATLDELRESARSMDVDEYLADNMVSDKHATGKSAYKQLVAKFGGGENASTIAGQAKASELLKNAGIPGVRYLDAGSRGAEGGTSNFVVFPGNEHMMTILERNGQAMSPESQAIARYREIKGPKSVVRMEAALRTAGVPLPKNEPVAYIQSLVDRAHRRN